MTATWETRCGSQAGSGTYTEHNCAGRAAQYSTGSTVVEAANAVVEAADAVSTRQYCMLLLLLVFWPGCRRTACEGPSELA